MLSSYKLIHMLAHNSLKNSYIEWLIQPYQNSDVTCVSGSRTLLGRAEFDI